MSIDGRLKTFIYSRVLSNSTAQNYRKPLKKPIALSRVILTIKRTADSDKLEPKRPRTLIPNNFFSNSLQIINSENNQI